MEGQKETNSTSGIIAPSNMQPEQLEATPMEQTPPVVETPVVPPKKKGIGILPIIIIVIIALVLIGGGAYKVITSSPKAIFKSNINKAYKEISSKLNDEQTLQTSLPDNFLDNLDLTEKTIYVKGNTALDVDTDMDLGEYKDVVSSLKDVNFSYEAGVDFKKEEILAGLNLNSISGQLLIKGGMQYLKTSFYDKVLQFKSEEDEDYDLGELKKEFKEMYSEIIKEYKDEIGEINTNPEDYDYILKTLKDALIDSLDSKSMKKESTTIEVNGKKVKATKVSYVLDKESTKELANSVIDKLLENDEFISKVASIAPGTEKDDIKDELKAYKDDIKEIDFKNEVLISIYTKGLLNETIGYSVESDGKTYLTIYKDGNTTEINYDNNAKDFGKAKFNILSEEKSGKKEITITANIDGKKDKVATLTVRDFDKNKIDFDYTIYLNNEFFKEDIKEIIEEIPIFDGMDSNNIPNFTGTFKYEVATKKDEKTVNYNFTAKWDKYIDIDVNEKATNKSRGTKKGFDLNGEYSFKMNLFDMITTSLDGKFGTNIGDTIENANLNVNYKFGIDINKDVMSILSDGEDNNYLKTSLSGTVNLELNEKGLNSFDTTGAVNAETINEEEFMKKLEEAISKDEKLKKIYDFLMSEEANIIDEV